MCPRHLAGQRRLEVRFEVGPATLGIAVTLRPLVASLGTNRDFDARLRARIPGFLAAQAPVASSSPSTSEPPGPSNDGGECDGGWGRHGFPGVKNGARRENWAYASPARSL